jgi:hypothetical protein
MVDAALVRVLHLQASPWSMVRPRIALRALSRRARPCWRIRSDNL